MSAGVGRPPDASRNRTYRPAGHHHHWLPWLVLQSASGSEIRLGKGYCRQKAICAAAPHTLRAFNGVQSEPAARLADPDESL
jgi:hypothetical protein